MGGKWTEAWSPGSRWAGSGLLYRRRRGTTLGKGWGWVTRTETGVGLTREGRGAVPSAEKSGFLGRLFT